MAAGVALSMSAIIVGLLTGCSDHGSPHPRAAAVIASTDVWGSVARAVAGKHATVKSILSGADADPHTYQVSAADAAAIADAALVVYNGGGYDPWFDRVLAEHPAIQSVDAYALLKTPGGSVADEHVFYNLDVTKAVAAQIADELAATDSRNAADYRTHAADFSRQVDAITGAEQAIAIAHPHAGVAATEPVTHYLLAATGLVNRIPTGFMEATENDDEPSPQDMATALDLIDDRQVPVLLINPQTATAATTALQAAAKRAGVPVVEVMETLPRDSDYLTWQRDTVDRLAAALGSGR